jgi:hypothetical protein
MPAADSTSPRHHYVFAHYALREVAFSEPIRIFNLLASDHRTAFFDDLLASIAERFPDSAPAGFTGADIQFHGMLIADRPCALLQMPPPSEPAEALWIALVSRLTPDQFSTAPVGNPEDLLDYYTLELPVEVSATRPSVFCSWSREAHANFGNGPIPDLQHFVPFLTAHVKRH